MPIMIHGGNATIYVGDMDTSIAFYTQTLGLRLVSRAGNHRASIDAGNGFYLDLHAAGADQPQPGTAGGVTVGLTVDQPLKQVIPILTRRGMAIRGPIQQSADEGGLKLAFFTDPDGNTFSLAETPTHAQAAATTHNQRRSTLHGAIPHTRRWASRTSSGAVAVTQQTGRVSRLPALSPP